MTALIRKRLRKMPDLRRGYLYLAAADLGISVTDLQYRLRREGSSYQKLLLEERRRRLLKLLEEDPHPHVLDIASDLGYISVKAARMAIKAWGGDVGMSGHTHRGRAT